MSVAEDYRLIREGAALGSIAPRRQIGLTGQDRASYLHGLLTNDIQSLGPGAGCYAAWLTPQGRMVTDMHVLQSESMILLDVPEQTAEATLARLDQFLFSEDVQLQPLADTMAGVWVHGPRGGSAVARAVEGVSDPEGWADYHHERGRTAGAAVSVARIDQLGVPGFCIFVERAHAAGCTAALQQGGATPVSADALSAARIEAGYPLFGTDMTEDTIPLEAGIEQRAISFSKGCYVGQEVIIRVLHRGGGRVARRLVGLTIDGDARLHVAAGDALFADGRQVGHITSVAQSPRLGTIALGYVHRDFVEGGSRLEAAHEDARAPVVVSPLPIRSSAA